MIVKAKIRGFICTTAHPVGCARHVQEQIQYIRAQPPLQKGPKKVLIIGASTGYGLASRIAAAFSSQAATVGVFYERPAEGARTATAGWYNSVAFEREAERAGLYARSINGDAFSDEVKQKAIQAIKADLGQVDCVIYSLASPRRVHPHTGIVYKSTLKPIGAPFTNKSIDLTKDLLEEVTLPPATPQDVEHTVAVMGGEDWEMWIDALDRAGVLAPGITTLAYSYMGPEVTYAVYRNGTIGAAKEHLEQTAHKLGQHLKKYQGRAFVSINKALVTQSSSAIPFIPLYFVILMKVMKKKGVHEDCIQQIFRLFSQRLYNGKIVPVDDQGRIRIDDWEMRQDVQAEVEAIWERINNENLYDIADVQGYHEDFLKLFGFGLSEVDYEADVDIDMNSPALFL
jgi:enoyl-[acyl-carrier protein] reductase/trans-2-enoyl-CoA reductase (NAD+)